MRAQFIGNGVLMARISSHAVGVLEALQLQGPSLDRLLYLRDDEWNEVLSLCDGMRLTLPLALRSSGRFPSWVSDRLMENLADTAQRFGLVRATYSEAAAVLARAEVPYVVLKGFAQSPDFVKAPQFRMQGDIDVYSPRENSAAALKALEAIGYEAAGPAEDYREADHPPTLIRFSGWKRGRNPFDPEMPLALEIHHCLWNPAVSLIELPEIEEFWDRRIERRLGALCFPALHPVDYLGYFALHMLREVFPGGSALHHALELATFLHARADDSAFWKEWQALHSPRLRQLQAIPLALAANGFSSRLPDAVQEEIEGLPPEQRRWIEMSGGNLLTGAFTRNRDGRLLQFLLSTSPGSRRKILWKAMSPGAIATPRKFSSWPEHPGALRSLRQRRIGGYLEYLAGRVAVNAAAILRFVANGVTLCVSAVVLHGGAP